MSTKKEIIRKALKKNPPAETTYGTDPLEPWSKKANITEETLDEASRQALLDKYLYAKGINPKYVTKDVRISHAKSGNFLKYQKDHEHDREEQPGLGEEILDELSSDKLNDYQKKAIQNASDSHKSWLDSGKTNTDKVRKILRKRNIGLVKANKKLYDRAMREDIDLEEGDKTNHTHEVINTKTGEQVGTYSSANRARTARDKKDMQHGSYVHKVRELQQVKEDVLTELSTEKLKQYVMKAGPSIRVMKTKAKINSHDRDKIKLADKADARTANREKALQRIHKEESESIDELSKPAMKAYAGKSANDFVKNFNGDKDRAVKRATGIKTAWRKIAQKDGPADKSNHSAFVEETLDELSKNTLKSYAKKSGEDRELLGKNAQWHHDQGNDDDAAKDWKKQSDRSMGMRKAMHKIAKLTPPAMKKEDTFNDPKAATKDSSPTQDNGGLGGSDLVEKNRSKLQIVKDLKKNKLKEELFDKEKESKSVATPGKKPSMTGKNFDKKLNADDETNARAVLKGGTTMTGVPRDTVIIDPSMRKPTTKGMNKQPDFPEKDQKSGPR